MADKEIEVHIKTSTDNEAVKQLVDDVKELDETSNKASESLSGIGESLDKLDAESIVKISQEGGESADVINELADMIEDARNSLNNIDSTNINTLEIEASEAGEKFQELADYIRNLGDNENSAQSFDEIADAINLISETASQIRTDGLYDLVDKAYGATDSLSDLNGELQNTADSADNVASSIDGISGEAFNEVNDAVGEATTSLEDYIASTEDAESSTSDLGDSVNDLNDKLASVDSEKIKEIGANANESKNEIDGLGEGILNMNDSLSMVDAMAGAELSSQMVSGYMGMANAAGNYNDTMVRLGYALDGTSMSAEQASEKFGGLVSTMTDATGRGAGAARNHLISLGNVGIKNTDILKSSFEGVSKAAFQMGKDFETVDGAFQRVTLSGMLGSRQLIQFGLNMNDIASVMGVSADEAKKKFKELDVETRASILSTALNQKYGADVTENYKNSYEHLIETLSRATDYLKRSVGEALLPIVVPAIETAASAINNLTKWFKSLPTPVKNAVGGFLSLSAGLTIVGTGFASLIKLVGFAFAPFVKLFNFLTGNVTTLGRVALAFKSLGMSALTAGYNALKSAAMWVVNKVQLLASAVASGLATVKNWALAISEWAVASPIALIVIAILALIAVLGYLYFNNEQVREAIDWLGQTMLATWDIIVSTVMGAVDLVIQYLTGFWDYLVGLGSSITGGVGLTTNNTVNAIIGFLAFMATLPIQLGIHLVNAIAKVLGFGNNFVQNMISAGSRSVSNFISYISQIPGKLGAELGNALNKVNEWAATLPAKFWEAGVNAVKNFLNALGINSPGTMQRMLVWEISEMGRRTPLEGKSLLSNVERLGSDVVNAFGEPKLKLGGFEMSDMNKFIEKLNETKIGNVEKQSLNNLIVEQNNNPLTAFRDLILNIGSIDDEKRAYEIIDIIKRELHWDNKTAGRSI